MLVETAGVEDELYSRTLVDVSLLGQIYTEEILFLDVLLCHVWWGHDIRPESAGSEEDLLTVNLFCMSA